MAKKRANLAELGSKNSVALEDAEKPASTSSNTAHSESTATAQRKKKRATTNMAPSRVGKVGITTHVDPDVRKQLKLISIETGIKLERLIGDGLNHVFKQHGKPPIA